MKKLTLIFLLIPFFVKAQVNYCVTRTSIPTALYNNVHDVTIDLKDIDPASGVIGIRFNNCYNIRIKRTSIHDGTTMGLYFYKCHDVLVDSCSFDKLGAGIIFDNCTGNCKAMYNQFRDMQGASPAVTHAIQYTNCSGAGNEAWYNKIQSAFNSKTGDLISVYKSYGTPTSRIKINRNKIYGGGTDFAFGPAGIILGDKYGDYQEAMDNVLVNTGYAGIQVQGGNHNVVKRDTIFGAVGITWSGLGLKFSNAESTNPTPAGVGDTAYQCVIKWWSGRNVPPKYRDTVYSSANGNQKPALWISQIVNASIDASIIPYPLFQECSLPNISYTTPVTYTVGTAITANTPTNTGGAITSFSISPGLSAGLSFNTSTGSITGTPTAVQSATNYTVVAFGTGGNDTTTVNITMRINAPHISYFPPIRVLIKNNPYSISPTNTGGVASSWSITGTLPTGLSFSTSTGIIGGTPTAVHTIQTYSITATNATGSDSTPLILTVISLSPTHGPAVQKGKVSPIRRPRS